MRPCAHSHMLTFPHTCQHRFINSHPMCTHTFGICIHSHARAFAHTRLRDLSLSPLLTNVWFPHGPHMCTCTLTSIHTHTSSCTRTCLDGYTPSPSLSPACACGCPPPHHTSLPLFPRSHHTRTPARGHMLTLPTRPPLALRAPDLLVSLCCSPPGSWTTAAASPVTSNWRVPAL